MDETSPLESHYQCPNCGLYMSRFLPHPEEICELIRALYPMLLEKYDVFEGED
jgi:hypothetical protein